MARPKNPVPTYSRHNSGHARARWTDAAGVRRERILPGPFDSEESRTAFARLVAELAAAPHAVNRPAAASNGVSVNELIEAFANHADGHYRTPDGTPSDEVRHFAAALRTVRELYGNVPAAQFGPLALKAVRQNFVIAGWCRNTVNARTDRVRRMFRWAVAEEMVPPGTYQALAAVRALQRGRTAAAESSPVRPVDDARVDATLPHLNRHVRGLVQFQRWTGCRPGEACRVRRRDIDTGGAVWYYRPPQHKGTWRGKDRTIAIGPRAQELLREYFTPNLDDYLFSPARATAEHVAERTAKRETPRYPSHMARNAAKRVGAKRKRPPADRYDRLAYGTAVDRACDRAFPPTGELARNDGESAAAWWARLTSEQRNTVNAWRKANRWSPNQLRHTFATEIRKAYGLEAAQVLLGHSKADVTQIYAERNSELAAQVAAKVG
jgi:integrase